MYSINLMLAVAQIAVGLAGFSAIIVTFNDKPIRDWDDTDRLSLRLLIQVSIMVIFFSLLPSLLLVSLSTNEVWLYGLCAYGLIHLGDVSFFLIHRTNATSHIFRNAVICGVCVALLQIGVVWLGDEVAREWLYVSTLLWHFGIVLMAFILLLYQLREPKR